MCGLLTIDGTARCMDCNCKRLGRVLTMLRGGNAALKIETGRWNGLKREWSYCKQWRR